MSRIAYVSIPLCALLSTVAACTDSELDGEKPIDRDGFSETFNGDVVGDVIEETHADTLEDATVDSAVDTTPVDVVDTFDTVDATDTSDTRDTTDTSVLCTSNESCRNVLGDLNACEDPVCFPDSGQCIAARRPDCCASDSDCPDLGDACLSNRCPIAGGGCVALSICTPCGGDDDCPVDDPCLVGRCGANGVCTTERNPSCVECQSAAQCNDGVACTTDSCVEGGCVHAPAPGCCILDGDCKDDDPCTRDFCRQGSGICGFEKIPNCTACDPSLCDDGDPCTQDICTNLGCTHITDPDCRGCVNDQQCTDGDDCTDDTCSNGRCSHTPAFNPDGTALCACDNDTQCDDGDACTTDVCSGGGCVSFPDPTLPECRACGGSTCDDFDDCTTDFCDGTNCQHVSIPGLPGCTKCASDDQCPNPDQCTKSFCDVQTAACVTVSVTDCCSSVMQCDDADRCTQDSCLDDGRCLHQAIPGCQSGCDAGCDDGDACTTDVCSANGTCLHNAITGCTNVQCTSDQQCQDNSDCTKNACVGGTCQTTSIPNCCRNTNDCRDGNPCTDQRCGDNGTCVYTQVACDDNDPCTRDACDPASGGCASTPDATLPGCQCEPHTLWTRKFVQGETPDVNIDGSGGDVRWRVDGINAFSPEQSLHYGDAAGLHYASNGRNFGRATGPQLEVPENTGEVRLDFRVYLDIDADVTKDSFRARVLWGNNNEIAWDRVSVGADQFKQWLPVSVALPAEVIGQTIQIRFVFDSIDGDGNQGRGVFVDDVVVYTTCP